MRQQIPCVPPAVIAGRRPRVLGQTVDIGEVAKQCQHQGRHDHPQHEPGQRHTGQAAHQQHAGIGGQDALRDVAHPAGDKSLLLGIQIAVSGIPDNVGTEDHGRRRGQQTDKHRRAAGIDPPVVEDAVQILLGLLDHLPGLQHPLQKRDQVQRNQHLQGVPLGEHPPRALRHGHR